jgi:uncharacterized integral membrane protein
MHIYGVCAIKMEQFKIQELILILIHLLPAIGLTPGGSSTVHIYTQIIHRTTQLTNWEQCGAVPHLCEL